jgi:hypothetical protein
LPHTLANMHLFHLPALGTPSRCCHPTVSTFIVPYVSDIINHILMRHFTMSQSCITMHCESWSLCSYDITLFPFLDIEYFYIYSTGT